MWEQALRAFPLHLREWTVMPTVVGSLSIVKILDEYLEVTWDSKNDMLHFLSGILFPE